MLGDVRLLLDCPVTEAYALIPSVYVKQERKYFQQLWKRGFSKTFKTLSTHTRVHEASDHSSRLRSNICECDRRGSFLEGLRTIFAT